MGIMKVRVWPSYTSVDCQPSRAWKTILVFSEKYLITSRREDMCSCAGITMGIVD